MQAKPQTRPHAIKSRQRLNGTSARPSPVCARAEVAAVYFGFGFGFGFRLPSLRFFVYLVSSCRVLLLLLVCKEPTKKATRTTTIEKSRLTTVTATWSRPRNNKKSKRTKKEARREEHATCDRDRDYCGMLLAGHRNKAWLLAEKQSRLSASLYLTLCIPGGRARGVNARQLCGKARNRVCIPISGRCNSS